MDRRYEIKYTPIVIFHILIVVLFSLEATSTSTYPPRSPSEANGSSTHAGSQQSLPLVTSSTTVNSSTNAHGAEEPSATASPSAHPSRSAKIFSAPSGAPSATPSNEPTTTATPTSPKPGNWFNYNPYSDFGPLNWGEVREKDSEFFKFIGKRNNECNDKKQSPVVLWPHSKCKDDHTPGDYRGSNKFDELEFAILPSGLRVYLGEDDGYPCLDWSNLSPCIDARFVDVKIKSEHHLFGKQYPGEFQIVHEFREKKKVVILSIMMDHTSDQENAHLEQFIREWEEVAWKQKNICDERNGVAVPRYQRTYSRPNEQEMESIWGENHSREKSDYNIYRFMTTGWYCGYDGSLTVPPCSERVHWRILDLPMTMSKSQYKRMENLLVERLNDKCEHETAAFNGKVNRPIQDNSNNVWCCTSQTWEMRAKDPRFWLESWPQDYHGWKGCEGEGCS